MNKKQVLLKVLDRIELTSSRYNYTCDNPHCYYCEHFKPKEIELSPSNVGVRVGSFKVKLTLSVPKEFNKVMKEHKLNPNNYRY